MLGTPEPMEEKEDESVQPSAASAQLSTTDVARGTSNSTRDLGFVSPVVAKIAAEHGVNLQDVPGTGINGRITKNDVLKFVKGGEQRAVSGQPAPRTAHIAPAITPTAGDQFIKHSTIRKQIAEHMVHIETYLTARADRDGSGYVEGCRPSQGQQSHLCKRQRQTDLYSLFYAGYRGGIESVPEC